MRRAAFVLVAAALGTLALRPAAALPFGPPSASLSWSPVSPSPSVTVTFTITAADPDGPITGGKLEYGDGTSESFIFNRNAGDDAAACVRGDHKTAVLRHVYPTRGEYPAKLTVEAGSCPGANLVVAGRTVKTYRVNVGPQDARPPASG